MVSGVKRPYLDFQKYRYDEKKRPIFSFFRKSKTTIKKLKVFNETEIRDNLNLQIGPNPFRKEIPKKVNWRKVFYSFFSLFFFIAWFWSIFYLSYFDIKNVSYYGVQTLDINQIKNFVFENFLKSTKYWHKNNYFVINPQKIAVAIKNNFDVADVKVEKIFPDILKIDIFEKKQSVIFCTLQGYYLLNEEGNVIKIFWESKNEAMAENYNITSDLNFNTGTASSSLVNTEIDNFKPNHTKVEIQYQDLPFFCIAENKRLAKDQKNVLSEKQLKALNYWFLELKKQGIGEVNYFLGQENQWSSVEIYFKNKDWYLKAILDDVDKQIIKLKSILDQETKYLPNEYIDLRFDDRVYWK